MEPNDALASLDPGRKTMSTWDVAILWTGINVCLPSFMLGGVLLPDLSPVQAFWVTVAGNLAVVILIFALGLPGVDRSWSSVQLTRSVFGHPAGSFVPSLAVTISMAGWGAVLLGVTGEAVNDLAHSLAGFNQPGLVITATGLAVLVTSLRGEGGIRLVGRFSVPPLLLLCGWLTYILLVRYGIRIDNRSLPAGGIHELAWAFDVVMGGTIAGAFVSSDLARFARQRQALGRGVLLGTLPAVVLAALGMFSQTATGYWNPVRVVGSLGMGLPALVLIILSTWTTNQAGLYSGGLALTNIYPRLHRKTGTFILGLASILLALLGASDRFQAFLLFLDHLFAPIAGVVLAAYLSSPGRDHHPPPANRRALLAAGAGLLGTIAIPSPLPDSISGITVSAIAYLLLRRVRP